jgi:hypothetical protein
MNSLKIYFGLFVIGAIILAMYPPINTVSAKKVLIQNGYYPISVGGYGWFECGDGDYYRTKFTAYNQDSTSIVTGCVCEGFLKGKTIRFN